MTLLAGVSCREVVVCITPGEQGGLVGGGLWDMRWAAFAISIAHSDHMPCQADFEAFGVFRRRDIFVLEVITEGGRADTHGFEFLETVLVFVVADCCGS